MAKTQKQAIEDHAPWKPPSFEPADAAAIQALSKGTASSEQQKRALHWIVNMGAGTYDFAYRPGAGDGERDTCIALGRQFVGQQIVKLLNLKIGMITTRRDGA